MIDYEIVTNLNDYDFNHNRLRTVKLPGPANFGGYHDPLTYILCRDPDINEAKRQTEAIFSEFEAQYGDRIQNIYRAELNELFAAYGQVAYLIRFLVAPTCEVTLTDNMLLSYEL